jgi:hypothetical protein
MWFLCADYAFCVLQLDSAVGCIMRTTVPQPPDISTHEFPQPLKYKDSPSYAHSDICYCERSIHGVHIPSHFVSPCEQSGDNE